MRTRIVSKTPVLGLVWLAGARAAAMAATPTAMEPAAGQIGNENFVGSILVEPGHRSTRSKAASAHYFTPTAAIEDSNPCE